MREFTVMVPCRLAAADFWSLRSDTGFDEWFAKEDKQTCDIDKNEVTVDAATGVESVDRNWRLAMQESQMPRALKAMLPSNAKFYVRMEAQFSPQHFDEAHPYSYKCKYPVFTERIQISGTQWVVPTSANSCMLHGKIKASAARTAPCLFFFAVPPAH